MAAVAVVAAGGYLAGMNGLLAAGSGGDSASPRTSSSSTVSAEVTTAAAGAGTAGTGTPGPGAANVAATGGASGGSVSTSGTVTTAPTIYDCPTNATSTVWGCLRQAKAAAGALSIAFTANFTLTAGQDANSHHFHLYLANPGPQGGTVPTDSIMQHGANPGSWFNIYSNAATVIDAGTERGGEKLGIDTAKYSLLCVRVASGLHGLVGDLKGGLATGNCVKITS